MENESTDRLELAAKFVNNTGAPIFLTGKAGTGKTTFLRDLVRKTHKRHVILAPTGIAALHAKGVTIHSQFLFPMGSFLPVREPEGNFTSQYGFFTQNTLARKHPLNQLRKNVLKAVDLLVIDEVSMLRADILDAIDYRMRSVKGNYRDPFGGVQVLMIGDLYQLPPIVRDNEWEILRQFYPSMHFFEAHALRNSGMVYLELDKIFRQQDEEFIRILNHLRDNEVSADDVQILNSHYKTEAEVKELPPCIMITTHNYKADQLNQKELDELNITSFFYDAEVEDDFPESLFPLPKTIELREGAQIMFVKNDSSGSSEYFNGKLAKVIRLSKTEVIVRMQDSETEFQLRKERWENKKYIINNETKELDEEVVGTFSQFPIKLAWAVTVHKSQGLTFDRAIIDVGQAFAPGQVYVALSRLRSLEGLVLRSRISSDLIQSDRQVVDFSIGAKKQSRLEELLDQHQGQYVSHILDSTFDFSPIQKELEVFQKDQASSMEFEDDEMRGAIPTIRSRFQSEKENSDKFRRQLLVLVHQNDQAKLQDRLSKGSQYYREIIANQIQQVIGLRSQVEHFSKTKKHQEGLELLEGMLIRKYLEISKVARMVKAILNGEMPGKMEELDQEVLALRMQFLAKAKEKAAEKIQTIKSKTGRKKTGAAKPKRTKGDSQELTFALFEMGKTIPQIAEERELAASTVKSHLADGIALGRIELSDCLPEEVISEIKSQFDRFKSVSALREHFQGKFDYGTLKMVFAGNKIA
jgi:hypothetical protein